MDRSVSPGEKSEGAPTVHSFASRLSIVHGGFVTFRGCPMHFEGIAHLWGAFTTARHFPQWTRCTHRHFPNRHRSLPAVKRDEALANSDSVLRAQPGVGRADFEGPGVSQPSHGELTLARAWRMRANAQPKRPRWDSSSFGCPHNTSFFSHLEAPASGDAKTLSSDSRFPASGPIAEWRHFSKLSRNMVASSCMGRDRFLTGKMGKQVIPPSAGRCREIGENGPKCANLPARTSFDSSPREARAPIS